MFQVLTDNSGQTLTTSEVALSGAVSMFAVANATFLWSKIGTRLKYPRILVHPMATDKMARLVSIHPPRQMTRLVTKTVPMLLMESNVGIRLGTWDLQIVWAEKGQRFRWIVNGTFMAWKTIGGGHTLGLWILHLESRRNRHWITFNLWFSAEDCFWITIKCTFWIPTQSQQYCSF